MPLHICYQQLYYKLSIFFLRFLTFGRLDSSLTYSSSYNYDFVWDEPDSFSKLASHHPATFIMVRKIIWCFKYVILYITSLYLAIISHCFLMQCSCEMISHFTSISFDFWKLPNLWHFFFPWKYFFWCDSWDAAVGYNGKNGTHSDQDQSSKCFKDHKKFGGQGDTEKQCDTF